MTEHSNVQALNPQRGSHSQGADVPLAGREEVNGGEGPVLAHHAGYLSREVAAGC